VGHRNLHGRARTLDGQRLHRARLAIARYADGCEAKAGIAGWIAFYNEQRLHQALRYRTESANEVSLLADQFLTSADRCGVTNP
jgi:hypothetical protein